MGARARRRASSARTVCSSGASPPERTWQRAHCFGSATVTTRVNQFGAANLVFGIYDLGGTPSQRGLTGRPDLLTAEQIEYFAELFTPGRSVEERRDPDISPLYADLHGLPPALFTVGADDHLVDDTLFMAARWVLAGNDAELLVYPESPHGCVGMPERLRTVVRDAYGLPPRPTNGG